MSIGILRQGEPSSSCQLSRPASIHSRAVWKWFSARSSSTEKRAPSDALQAAMGRIACPENTQGGIIARESDGAGIPARVSWFRRYA